MIAVNLLLTIDFESCQRRSLLLKAINMCTLESISISPKFLWEHFAKALGWFLKRSFLMQKASTLKLSPDVWASLDRYNETFCWMQQSALNKKMHHMTADLWAPLFLALCLSFIHLTNGSGKTVSTCHVHPFPTLGKNLKVNNFSNCCYWCGRNRHERQSCFLK